CFCSLRDSHVSYDELLCQRFFYSAVLQTENRWTEVFVVLQEIYLFHDGSCLRHKVFRCLLQPKYFLPNQLQKVWYFELVQDQGNRGQGSSTIVLFYR